jgi:hypothetical protein
MLSLLLALAPLPAQDAWVPLPLPEPCREAPDGGGPRAAEGGRHLVLE